MANVSTFFGLQTSLRGLLAHQRSLDVTGHNVANASTVGYSRQEATLATTDALHLAAGAKIDGSGAQLGSGVMVEDYRRIRDGFLDVQFRAQNTVLGDADARARAMEGVELSIAEPGTNGVSAALTKMWSAWTTVSNNAPDNPARQVLVDSAKGVALAFKEVDTQLKSLQSQAQQEFAGLTKFDPATGQYGEVGQIANQLAAVGEAIRHSSMMGETPNDLLDQRDLLLDKLSNLGTVQTVDLGDGGLRVMFGGAGTPLVDDSKLDDKSTPGDDRVSFDPTALLSPGGKLGALKSMGEAGGAIESYRTELAAAVKTLADQVNAIHSQGPSGEDFFAFDATQGASGLTVIQTAATVQVNRDGTASGADIAREIAALRGGAADQAYQVFVARVGSESKQVQRTQANAETLLTAVDDRRLSVSGVSLDEEMTNLIRFQRGYQASARTMSTLDEMLETLINRTGRVGL
ncbi:MAG TPA: flagellar hook-associated protein FlgK [Solirubrobacteraceae bacterium]|nr:flagellar hook-associated protein FlgK [Solirubrobacteraceae bacterium]